MGTVVARQRKDKSTAYLAKISIMQEGKTYRENRTFDRKPAALAWIAKREEELSRPGEIERAAVEKHTLADAIDKYTTESLKKIGRTKAQVLRSLKTYHIASLPCDKIGSAEIVALAAELSKGRKPQTVNNYLSHLSGLFAIARPAWGFQLDETAMRDAQKVTKRLGTTKKSDQRDRRPTLDELDRIMSTYQDRQKRRPDMAPMTHIVAFAIFSTRRQEEVTRIAWDDFDEAHSRVLVRDMKNPGEKIGNDVWCDLPAPAVAIIKAMPKTAPEIFPYTADAISASFTRLCQLLDIEDLHFHDLRHDGVSRLFELDYSIPKAAAVSGHRSWNSLKRYTHLKHTGDKYENWSWLPFVTATATA
jgi:integrase